MSYFVEKLLLNGAGDAHGENYVHVVSLEMCLNYGVLILSFAK